MTLIMDDGRWTMDDGFIVGGQRSIVRRHQCPDIHLQNIRVHDAHVRLAGKTVAEERDQTVIQLDGDHAAGLLGDQLGEHAGTGADLQHRVVRCQLSRGDDAGAMRRVDQKVLAQALLWVDAESGELGKNRYGSRR